MHNENNGWKRLKNNRKFTNMFRAIAIAGFVITFVCIIIHYFIHRPKFDNLFGADRKRRWLDWLRLLVYPFTLLFIEQKHGIIGVVRKLIFLLGLICFLILLITGFVPMLFFGEMISGYWLMLHATFAGVFIVCVTVLAVMWAHNCVFDKNYLPRLNRLLRRQPKSEATAEKFELKLKISFWMIIFLTLPTALSIILSMFTFFGTYGQELLIELHRYCALVLALFIIVHIYLLIVTEMRKTLS